MSYEEYVALGHEIVPMERFAPYLARAEAVVSCHTRGRIASMQPPEGANPMVEGQCKLNRRGVCELVDLFYLADNPRSDAAMSRRAVAGFHNQKYGESYVDGAGVAGMRTVADVMRTYFTRDQLWRGRDDAAGDE